MKYENMRSGVAQQIRQTARDVCNLLMNRSKLFHQRRFLAMQRKESEAPMMVLKRDTRINFVSMKFSDVHAKLKPAGLLVQTTPTPDLLNVVTVPPSSVVDQLSQTIDLLSIQSDLSQTPNTLLQPISSNNVYPQQQTYYGYSVTPQQQYISDTNTSVPQVSKGSYSNFDPFA